MDMPEPRGLQDYKFGFAAAEEERAYSPTLLAAGYHDPEGLIQEALWEEVLVPRVQRRR